MRRLYFKSINLQTYTKLRIDKYFEISTAHHDILYLIHAQDFITIKEPCRVKMFRFKRFSSGI